MPRKRSGFFNSKDAHPWSRVKDRILGTYLKVYFAKINRIRNPVFLVDAFAGPGLTEDGEPGSPLIICKAAEIFEDGKFHAFFVNKNEAHHKSLGNVLRDNEYENLATTIRYDGPSILKDVAPQLTDHTVFLYVDPFGVECEFDALEAFLDRSKYCSTEILINLQMPIVHRLAARDATEGGENVSDIFIKWHEKLTRIFGGDYWKECLFSDEETKVREEKLISEYEKRLASTGYLTFTGSCPIRERPTSATKYFMVFASRHPDAMAIFNDAMCKAVNEYFTAREMENSLPLFPELAREYWRDTRILNSLVTKCVKKHPSQTRKDLHKLFVKEHFALYTRSEFINTVKELVDSGKIICSTPVGSPERKRKSLNDNCVLMPRS